MMRSQQAMSIKSTAPARYSPIDRYVTQSRAMSAVLGMDVVRGMPQVPDLMFCQIVGKKMTARPALARAIRRSVITAEYLDVPDFLRTTKSKVRPMSDSVFWMNGED